MDKNIVEVVSLYNKQFIVLVSGLSGSGKSKIANYIHRDFKLELINLENYCNNSNDIVVELSNNVKVVDWDNVETYNWEKFNEDVKTKNNKNLVIYGDMFPTAKINFKVDYHIHIKISKQKLIKVRHDFLINNPDKCPELTQYIDTPTELLIINKITYPHYLEYLALSKFDKIFDATDIDIDNIYDGVFDFLIDSIKSFLKKHKNYVDKFLNKLFKNDTDTDKDTDTNTDKDTDKDTDTNTDKDTDKDTDTNTDTDTDTDTHTDTDTNTDKDTDTNTNIFKNTEILTEDEINAVMDFEKANEENDDSDSDSNNNRDEENDEYQFEDTSSAGSISDDGLNYIGNMGTLKINPNIFI